MLAVDPTSPTRGPARLRDYVWGGAAWDRAEHHLAGGDRWLVCSRVEGDRRVLRHWLRRPWGLQALDETVFRLAPDFAEVERRYTRAQPNQHPRPLALPPELGVGVDHEVLPGVWATLDWHGWATLSRPDATAHVPALALRVRAAGEVRVQWLVRGVGEVALGPPGGPWVRWLHAWSGGDASLLGGLPSIDPSTLPDLPDTAPARATGVF